MYVRHTMGPRTDPCGTQNFISLEHNNLPISDIHKLHLHMKITFEPSTNSALQTRIKQYILHKFRDSQEEILRFYIRYECFRKYFEKTL